MVRNALLILFAICIDLLQALIALSFFVMGAFPGTVGGGTAGCLLGSQVAGGIGCAFLGTVAGAVGSIGDAAAGTTLPIAVGLGFAVNVCMDAFLGTILIGLLWVLGMYYPRYGITGLIAELIPGINDLPGWTIMTVLCVIRKTAEEKRLVSAGGMFQTLMTTGITGIGASAVFAINSASGRLVREQSTIRTQEDQDSDRERIKHAVSTELKNIDGIRARTESSMQHVSTAHENPSYA